jgi:dynein regulatory complex protein 1
MNEELAKEKLRKVLQADRIIHEQQLGLPWTPPDEDLFKSAEHATEKVERRDKEPVAAALMIASTIIESGDEDEGGVKDSFGVKLTRKGYSKTMKRMLELLCNEAGFLVEERLQKLLNPLHRDEQSLMKLDSILKALGVETVEDIESLTSYFVSKHNSDPDAKVKVNPTDGSAVLITPNQVVKAIRKFVEDQRKKSGEEHARPSEEPEEIVPEEISQDKIPATNYWEKFGTCLNESNYRTWSAVYVGMEKYNQVLGERWQLTQEITSVTRQNLELRLLLKQYMTARVNDDLHVPPTRILLAQAGLLQK